VAFKNGILKTGDFWVDYVTTREGQVTIRING